MGKSGEAREAAGKSWGGQQQGLAAVREQEGWGKQPFDVRQKEDAG